MDDSMVEFRDAINEGRRWTFEIYHDVGADSYAIAEGDDRDHRGLPVAGFENRSVAEAWVAWASENR